MKLGLGEKITESNQVEHPLSPHEIDQFYQQHTPVNKFTIKQQNFYEKNSFLILKINAISPSLIQLHNGLNMRVYMGSHSGGLTTRPKKVFQNKLHSSADKILFELDHFFKLQNVVKKLN